MEVKYDSIIDEMIEDWLDHKQKLHFLFGLVPEEHRAHVYLEFCSRIKQEHGVDINNEEVINYDQTD